MRVGAEVRRGLGGLSGVADQQAAAGVMVAIGSIPFAIAVFVYLCRSVGTERSQEMLPVA